MTASRKLGQLARCVIYTATLKARA